MSGPLTEILHAAEQGDPQASARLLPLVYEELRCLAAARLAQERPGQTLQPTALVHEVYLRVVGGAKPQAAWEGRGHFFAACAEAMRRILVENARRKKRLRHGGGRRRRKLSEVASPDAPPDDLLALDEALTQLAQEDATAAEVAKLRLFAGLSVEEAAQALGTSRAATYRHWTYAHAWLRAALAEDSGNP